MKLSKICRPSLALYKLEVSSGLEETNEIQYKILS